MDLTLPLDYSAIERILPHRYPFLLVDRITEFEPDQRIVGIKNVSMTEPYLARPVNGRPSLPPTILTEAVAQVGAILILAKPENKDQLIFFRGMERVRFRGPVYPGDVVVIEASVKRLRSRMGVLAGQATVNGKVVINGTMTFALGLRVSKLPKLSALTVEDSGWGFFLCTYKEVRTGRSGGEFLFLSLQDASAQVVAKMMTDVERFKSRVRAPASSCASKDAAASTTARFSSCCRRFAASIPSRIAWRAFVRRIASSARRVRSTRCGRSCRAICAASRTITSACC